MRTVNSQFLVLLTKSELLFPQSAHSSLLCRIFVFRHSPQETDVKGWGGGFFFFFAAFKDKSTFMATKFVGQLREAICLCGWYTQALWRAWTAGEQKFHDKPPKYRVGWSAYRSCTSGQRWFWKTSQQERKTLQMNPMAFPPHHLFQKDEAEQLPTREQVILYWPGGLIIDSGHFTDK